MSRFVFDTEFNGFLEDATTLHCLVLYDIDTDALHECADQPGYMPLSEGLKMLAEADELIGHFIIPFDLPALLKVRGFRPKPTCKITDTVVICRVLFTDIGDSDNRLIAKGILDKSLWGSHKLEAWGQRLGNKKMKYEGGFEQWNPEMQIYCRQDVLSNVTLYRHILKRMAELKVDPTKPWWEIEHGVTAYCAEMERSGFPFNKQKIVALYGRLAERRMILQEKVRETFQPIYVEDGVLTPKRDNKKMGYTEGATLTKVALQEFNPGSRQQIVERLRRKYGWHPTEKGNPKVDDDVLAALPWPEAKLLGEFFMVDKRISQIAEGDEAWLKAERNGRIHGGINPGGTNTGRAAHSKPNLGQVPAVKVPYGKECREAFEAERGFVLLGADLSGIELRCLAHYLAPFDGGDYARTVIEGDVHMKTVTAIGTIMTITRETAKTFIYAYLYGAGDVKLGRILNPLLTEQKLRALGKAARAAIERYVPGLGELQRELRKAWARRGYIFGLDGRPLFPRSDHSVLNTLLQNCGAVVAKKWLLTQEQELVAFAHIPHAWVHDEVQMSVRPEEGDAIGKLICAAAGRAGVELGFRCRVDAAYKIGRNWAETH